MILFYFPHFTHLKSLFLRSFFGALLHQFSRACLDDLDGMRAFAMPTNKTNKHRHHHHHHLYLLYVIRGAKIHVVVHIIYPGWPGINIHHY